VLRMRRYAWNTLVACVVLGVVCAVSPASLHAFEVRVADVENLNTVDLSVSLSAHDTTGTVLLSAGGTMVDAWPMVPGETVVRKGVALAPGTYQASATLRARESVESTFSDTFRVWSVPAAPEVLSPGRYATQSSALLIKAGASTTWIQAFVNGKRVFSGSALPGKVMNLGRLDLARGDNSLEFIATNPVAEKKYVRTVTRLDFPWSTCIVIDKSEFKLYWVKNGALVKVYPVAIGKNNTPTPAATWRIDAKYHTDPAGVYGPRKMRLFRKTSSGYTYTAYAVHGTNEPWVIGTKASHGCIRMDNKDVLELFPQVPLGTMVQTRE